MWSDTVQSHRNSACTHTTLPAWLTCKRKRKKLFIGVLCATLEQRCHGVREVSLPSTISLDGNTTCILSKLLGVNQSSRSWDDRCGHRFSQPWALRGEPEGNRARAKGQWKSWSPTEWATGRPSPPTGLGSPGVRYGPLPTWRVSPADRRLFSIPAQVSYRIGALVKKLLSSFGEFPRQRGPRMRPTFCAI